MTGPKRGFTKERHGGVKSVIAGVAVLGFAAAWTGFARSHGEASDVATADNIEEPTPVPAPATSIPVPPTPTPTPPTQAGSTPAASPPKPTASATKTPKRSRGS